MSLRKWNTECCSDINLLHTLSFQNVLLRPVIKKKKKKNLPQCLDGTFPKKGQDPGGSSAQGKGYVDP